MVPPELNGNRRQKQIHTYYTNIPTKFIVYANQSTKYFVSFRSKFLHEIKKFN